MKLMKHQTELEEHYRKTFMDLSLNDTIYQVMLCFNPKDDQSLSFHQRASLSSSFNFRSHE